jgi:hypothetical protein
MELRREVTNHLRDAMGLILVEWTLRLGVTLADGRQGGIRIGFIPYFLERQKQWKEFTEGRLFLIKRDFSKTAYY